jgi:hypothetical protein
MSYVTFLSNQTNVNFDGMDFIMNCMDFIMFCRQQVTFYDIQRQALPAPDGQMTHIIPQFMAAQFS